MRTQKGLLVVLLLFNSVLLLGQVWPEGAPPFAREANILFACCNLAYLGWALMRAGRSGGSA